MLYVAQAICGSVSHSTKTSSSGVRPHLGSKSPRLALGLLSGVEEPQSFRCIGKTSGTSQCLLGYGSTGGLRGISEDNGL